MGKSSGLCRALTTHRTAPRSGKVGKESCLRVVRETPRTSSGCPPSFRVLLSPVSLGQRRHCWVVGKGLMGQETPEHGHGTALG